jgi:hypothetical protein
MSDKFSFKPFILYDQPTNEALYRINAIMALHTGYKASGLPRHKFALEFTRQSETSSQDLA